MWPLHIARCRTIFYLALNWTEVSKEDLPREHSLYLNSTKTEWARLRRLNLSTPRSLLDPQLQFHVAHAVREIWKVDSDTVLLIPDSRNRYNDPKAEEYSSDEDSPLGPASSGSPGLFNLTFRKTKDGQNVNTALVDFLNAFIVHYGSHIRWTLYQSKALGCRMCKVISPGSDRWLLGGGREKRVATSP